MCLRWWLSHPPNLCIQLQLIYQLNVNLNRKPTSFSLSFTSRYPNVLGYSHTYLRCKYKMNCFLPNFLPYSKSIIIMLAVLQMPKLETGTPIHSLYPYNCYLYPIWWALLNLRIALPLPFPYFKPPYLSWITKKLVLLCSHLYP